MKNSILICIFLFLLSCTEKQDTNNQNSSKKDTLRQKTKFLSSKTTHNDFIALWRNSPSSNVKDIFCELIFYDANQGENNYQRVFNIAEQHKFLISLIGQHLDSAKTNTILKQYFLSSFNKTEIYFTMAIPLEKYLQENAKKLNEFQKFELLGICIWLDHYTDYHCTNMFRKYVTLIIPQEHRKVSKETVINFIFNHKTFDDHIFMKDFLSSNYDSYALVNEIYNELNPKYETMTNKEKERFYLFLFIGEYKEYEAQMITKKQRVSRQIYHKTEPIRLFDTNFECIDKYIFE
jgi:hypothetical protein